MKAAGNFPGHRILYEATWQGRTFVLKFLPPDVRVESCGHLELALLREAKPPPHVVNLLGYLRWPDLEKGLRETWRVVSLVEPASFLEDAV